MTQPLVYFYPHSYLRDYQLDTIRQWPTDRALNREIAVRRVGAQVSRSRAIAAKRRPSWQQRIPLINLKSRPKGLPADAAVYCWGGLLRSGPFIIDLDNPYAVTGYNWRAAVMYRPIIRRMLAGSRCRGIRCMSHACREGLGLLFGPECRDKAHVWYPCVPHRPASTDRDTHGCRLLFVSTQFEIKGGGALLNAFRLARQQAPNLHLDLVTHLPPEYERHATQPGVTVHEATFTREEIADRFLAAADVLVHPTYADSFGMIVLEALAAGLPIIATDVYALCEMIDDGVNGFLLAPPISVWDGIRPSRHAYAHARFKQEIRRLDTGAFEAELAGSIVRLAGDPQLRAQYRAAGLTRYARMCGEL